MGFAGAGGTGAAGFASAGAAGFNTAALRVLVSSTGTAGAGAGGTGGVIGFGGTGAAPGVSLRVLASAGAAGAGLSFKVLAEATPPTLGIAGLAPPAAIGFSLTVRRVWVSLNISRLLVLVLSNPAGLSRTVLRALRSSGMEDSIGEALSCSAILIILSAKNN